MIAAVRQRLQRRTLSRAPRAARPRGPDGRPAALERPARRRAQARTRRRLRLRALIVAVVAAGLLALGWLWLRDSSLVAVDRVNVSGASGPDATQISAALVTAARNMTTLDVHEDQLRSAVAPFPVVKRLQVSTHFPHGMRIRVIERIPVAAVLAGGQSIAVAGDGTLLHDVTPSAALPAIPLRVVPGGSRLTDGGALQAVELLAAAPSSLVARVATVMTIAPHGLVAQLRDGPGVYFGDLSRIHAKWTAAASVVADPSSAGAGYIDVTDPDRPAAGAPPASSTTTSAGTTSANAPGTGG